MLKNLSENVDFLQDPPPKIWVFVLPRASKNLVGPGHPRTSGRHWPVLNST